MGEKKDFLFVVPNQFIRRYKRVIDYVLWATGDTVTYDVMTGNQFANAFGRDPQQLRSGYDKVGHTGDLSKVELGAYKHVIDRCIESEELDDAK